MPKDELLSSQELLRALSKSQKPSPQETGAGNACVIAEDRSTAEFAREAVPTQPAGCHSDSDRQPENALLFCKIRVQWCPKAVRTLSSLQSTNKVWGLQLLDSSRLSAPSSHIVTAARPLHAALSCKARVRAKLRVSLAQAILHAAHPSKPGLHFESRASKTPVPGAFQPFSE